MVAAAAFIGTKGATIKADRSALESAWVVDSVFGDIYMNRDMATRDESRVPALPLRTNWFHILLCLADGEQHGYAIMQEVLERTDGQVRLWPATLYGTLRRLIEEGLIEESGERPAAELDDARRRYYRLLPRGRCVLTDEITRLEGLMRAARAKRRALRADS